MLTTFSTFGPLVLMVFQMCVDVARFAVILALVIGAFSSSTCRCTYWATRLSLAKDKPSGEKSCHPTPPCTGGANDIICHATDEDNPAEAARTYSTVMEMDDEGRGPGSLLAGSLRYGIHPVTTAERPQTTQRLLKGRNR